MWDVLDRLERSRKKKGWGSRRKENKSCRNLKGLLYWMCIKLSTMIKDTYLYPALTESQPFMINTFLTQKEKYSKQKYYLPNRSLLRTGQPYLPASQQNLPIGNEPLADPPCWIHHLLSKPAISFFLIFTLTRVKISINTFQGERNYWSTGPAGISRRCFRSKARG